MYKVSFGYNGTRGVEYASVISADVIAALWNHKGATVYIDSDGDYFLVHEVGLGRTIDIQVTIEKVEMHEE